METCVERQKGLILLFNQSKSNRMPRHFSHSLSNIRFDFGDVKTVDESSVWSLENVRGYVSPTYSIVNVENVDSIPEPDSIGFEFSTERVKAARLS